ncbi:unnamed protein product, partial [Urochloa humidicola]
WRLPTRCSRSRSPRERSWRRFSSPSLSPPPGTPMTAAVRGAAPQCTTVERALGAATITTYERAAAAEMAGEPAPEGKASDRCAICLSEYDAGGGELVRVVPACGHFFHVDCGVDGWLRARRTCPLCRGGLLPLPPCPPMPPKHSGGAVAAVF